MVLALNGTSVKAIGDTTTDGRVGSVLERRGRSILEFRPLGAVGYALMDEMGFGPNGGRRGRRRTDVDRKSV